MEIGDVLLVLAYRIGHPLVCKCLLCNIRSQILIHDHSIIVFLNLT